MEDRIAELEKKLAKQEKINAVLMKRVEHSFDSQGNAFSMFKAASSLEVEVRNRSIALERTARELSNTNARLAQTLNELEESQHRLIQFEKLAALGQFIAGIAHEINTPLSVIRSSIDNMDRSVNHIIDELLVALSEYQQNDLALFLELMKVSQSIKIELSAKEARQARRQICKDLEQRGVNSPEVMSELIIDMGIEEIAPFIDRLEEDNALSVVEHVSYFRSLRLNTSHISLAVERASKVVFALKTYSHQDSTNHLTQTDMNKDLLTVLTL